MSQVVYTELEAFPLRWPYLQLEPLDSTTTKTWQAEQTFNIPSYATYTPADVGGTVQSIPLYGQVRLGQVLKRQAGGGEFWDNLELSLSKVGSPGPLRVEIYRAVRSSTEFLADGLREGGNASNTDSVSPTTWKATTRNFPNKIRIAGILFTTVNPGADRLQVRNAQPDGRPGPTVIADITATSEYVFNPPLELGPGLYSFVLFRSSGTGYVHYNMGRVPASDFGSDHSAWTSTNSGSTWTSSSVTNYYVALRIHPRAWVPETKYAEYEIPASSLTGGGYTSILPSDGMKILPPADERLYVVLSSPGSPDTNNCYMVQRGGTYNGITGSGSVTDDAVWEHSLVFDGAATAYKPHDLLIRKTYLPVSADIFDKTYFIGPGSYAPKVSIQIRAASGTVFARPIVFNEPVFAAAAAEKSTTSTTYTTLTWDTASGVPEIRAPAAGQLRILVRGNGAYNQTSYEPRIYYDKNPVAPRDFGFTELYLIRLRAEVADTLARINDKTNMYFATAGDSVVIDPSFRAPINKIHVVKGKITADLLGVV
ncbi:MAG: hypothetical protein QXS12_03650 [Candidatus Caldarchaeum sp.]